MYRAEIKQLDEGRVRHFRLLQNDRPLSWADVVYRWQNEHAFSLFYIALLVDAPYQAFFWETPPVSRATFDREFEFVLVDSPQLADARTDKQAFAEHFAAARPETSIIEFSNLGRDATLLVPCPRGPVAAYSQLRAFVNQAPEDQQHQLWQRVGAALERRLGTEPVWISTSGLGVYWLHIRFDSAPKYYTYRPYRAAPHQDRHTL